MATPETNVGVSQYEDKPSEEETSQSGSKVEDTNETSDNAPTKMSENTSKDNSETPADHNTAGDDKITPPKTDTKVAETAGDHKEPNNDKNNDSTNETAVDASSTRKDEIADKIGVSGSEKDETDDSRETMTTNDEKKESPNSSKDVHETKDEKEMLITKDKNADSLDSNEDKMLETNIKTGDKDRDNAEKDNIYTGETCDSFEETITENDKTQEKADGKDIVNDNAEKLQQTDDSPQAGKDMPQDDAKADLPANSGDTLATDESNPRETASDNLKDAAKYDSDGNEMVKDTETCDATRVLGCHKTHSAGDHVEVAGRNSGQVDDHSKETTTNSFTNDNKPDQAVAGTSELPPDRDDGTPDNDNKDTITESRKSPENNSNDEATVPVQHAAESSTYETHNKALQENAKRAYDNEVDPAGNELPTKKVKSSEHVSDEAHTLKQDHLNEKDRDLVAKRSRHRTSNSTSSTASPAAKKLAADKTNKDNIHLQSDEEANMPKMLDFTSGTDSEDTHGTSDEQGLGDSGASGDSFLGKKFTLKVAEFDEKFRLKVSTSDTQGGGNTAAKETHKSKKPGDEKSKGVREHARGRAPAATRRESEETDTESSVSSGMEEPYESFKREEAQKKLAQALEMPQLESETSDSADSSDTETVKDSPSDREADEKTPTREMGAGKPSDKQSRQDPGEGTSTGEQGKGHPSVNDISPNKAIRGLSFGRPKVTIEQLRAALDFQAIKHGNDSSASASEQENQSPQSQGSSVDLGLDLDNPKTPQQSETKSAIKVQRGNTLEDQEEFMPTSGIQHDSSLVTESTEQHEQASEQQPSTDSRYSSGIRSSSASGTSRSSSMPIARSSGTSGSSSADVSPSVSVSTSVDNVAITEGSVSGSGPSSNSDTGASNVESPNDSESTSELERDSKSSNKSESSRSPS